MLFIDASNRDCPTIYDVKKYSRCHLKQKSQKVIQYGFNLDCLQSIKNRPVVF